MKRENFKQTFEKAQAYLEGRCEAITDGLDDYEYGFGHCLRKLAKDFGLDQDEFGVPHKDDNE